jgi:hypothetical protein
MIDPDWLRRVIAFAEADTKGLDAALLAALLDEPAEVLPYLFTRADGFAGWTKARAALTKAGANAVRQPPHVDRAPRAAAASPDREALYAALHASVTGEEDDDLAADEEKREPASDPATLERLIANVRLDERRGIDSPSMFITGD